MTGSGVETVKTALVTGSGRGIGRAVACRLAADGFRVIVHGAKNAAAAEETKRLIEERGGRAEAVLFDLRDLDGVRDFAAGLGNVDALVLNASVQNSRLPWREIREADLIEHFNCNFFASLFLIQAFEPHMREQHWGRIVTVGSVQEAKPHPNMLAYSASKAAQTNMMRSLSLQLAKDGITVNNVAPGVIATDRNAAALSDAAYARAVTDSIPLGRYGKPEDCAGLVAFLCSDAARYITGQSIYADGGKGIA